MFIALFGRLIVLVAHRTAAVIVDVALQSIHRRRWRLIDWRCHSGRIESTAVLDDLDALLLQLLHVLVLGVEVLLMMLMLLNMLLLVLMMMMIR